MTVQIAAASSALILGEERRREGRWIGWNKGDELAKNFATSAERKAKEQCGLILDTFGRDALREVRDGAASLNAANLNDDRHGRGATTGRLVIERTADSRTCGCCRFDRLTSSSTRRPAAAGCCGIARGSSSNSARRMAIAAMPGRSSVAPRMSSWRCTASTTIVDAGGAEGNDSVVAAETADSAGFLRYLRW